MNAVIQAFTTIAVICLPTIHSPGLTYSVLHSFGEPSKVTGFAPQGTLVQASDGSLYGTAPAGEGNVAGVVFKILPNGTGFSVLHAFTRPVLDVAKGGLTNSDGATPYGGLALSGNTLFGTAENGGIAGRGTVFQVNTDGSGFAVIHNFSALKIGTNSDGANPYAGLILSGSTLFGTAQSGGSGGNGTVFKVATDGTGFETLHHFSALTFGTNSDGANPYAGLVLAGDTLYGTAYGGGVANSGIIFKLATSGGGFVNLFDFGSINGVGPRAALTLSGGLLYGTTVDGGVGGQGTAFGTVFSVSTNGTGFKNLHTFTYYDGSKPNAGVIVSGGILYGTTATGGTGTPSSHIGTGYGTVFKLNTNGTSFTNFFNFNFDNGADPYASVVLSGTTLFGVTAQGGAGAAGNVFRVGTNGKNFTNLFNFVYNDASGPGGPVAVSESVLYGTTRGGGSVGAGTVFRVNTNGSEYAILKTFTNSLESATPTGGLVLSDNVLFGTTSGSGASYGTVFSMHTNGTAYTNIFTFRSASQGTTPGTLLLSGDMLYGTTYAGGLGSAGTVYKLNTNGTGFVSLYSFSAVDPSTYTNADGANPVGGLWLSGTTLYGAASQGGTANNGALFKVNTDGTGFANLHNFDRSRGPGSASPQGNLVLSGSTLFGTTSLGGAKGFGTVFKIEADGSGYSDIYSFSFGADGGNPYAGLVLSGGLVYGATSWGGAGGGGTIFKMSTNGTGFAILHAFNSNDGANPTGVLLLSGSALYGAALGGGTAGDGVAFALDLSPAFKIQPDGNKVVLSWDNPSFFLQQASTAAGVYIDFPGAVSPFTIDLSSAQQFFRLRSN